MNTEVTFKDIIDHYGIKNVLILENQTLDSTQKRFAQRLEEAGCVVVIVEHAYLDESKLKIMAALPSTDTIFFETQFLYWEEVQGVGKLLMSVKRPLNVFGRNITDKTLMQGIEDTFDIEDLAAMSHHRVFELHSHYAHPDMLKKVEHFAEEKNMTRFKEKVEADERKKMKAIAAAPKEKRRAMEILMRDVKETGRTVRIKNVNACGSQWSNLKPGMEVPELDCLHMDPNPDRGVWVMGLHEPVKLLNDTGYDEWEYVNPDAIGLGLEILSMCRARATSSILLSFIPWISKAMLKIYHYEDKGEGQVHYYITELLDAYSIPRRGYRSTIMTKIKAYADKHKFFGDDSIDVRRKVAEFSKRAEARKAIIMADQLTKKLDAVS